MQAPNQDPGLRSFRHLVGAQFFGAFNDNLFKQLILFLAANLLFPGEDKQGLAFAVFALPFVLFSGVAGDLSEKHSKRTIIVQAKVAEIVIMALGVVAFLLQSWAMLLGVLFIMGLQSAFFGPSKYGVLPELVPPTRLMRANGTIAMTTFLSVLLGQALAGPLMDNFGDRLWVPGLTCVGFAVLGTWFAVRMGPLSPQKPNLSLVRLGPVPSPFGTLLSTMKMLARQEGLMRLVVLYSIFWFNGGVIQQAILGLGEPAYLNVVEGEKALLSYLLVTLAVSIIAGSVAAPRLAPRLGTPRMVFGGALLMGVAQLAVLLLGPVVSREAGGLYLAHIIFAFMGFCGAFFVVPVQTYMQSAPPPGMRGQTWAVNNFMNFLFIFLGGVYYLLARHRALDIGPAWAQAIAGGVMLLYVLWVRRDIARMNFTSA